jgi:DmsE family decaheme c-type cytochrome
MTRWTWLWFGLAAAGPVLGASASAGARVDWTALDPDFAGATFVGDDAVCVSCHEDYEKAYAATRHAQAFRLGGASGNCESCHGPRSAHVENPGNELAFSALTPAQQSAVCLQCHEGGARMVWKSGAHSRAEVSCASCHHVMERISDRALLIRDNSSEGCLTCHADVRAKLQRTSHHPVREGRLECASCHDPHGSTAPALLRGSTANESCVSCHAEKRGPFIWEHAPVRESCLNCHDAHGSNNRTLLTAKDSFLCLQCHSYGGHINLPRYNRTSNPYSQGCVNCHSSVHGSNHPSGAKLTR